MLGSVIGQFGHPFYVAFASLLAGFYALLPNYAAAIALSTVAVLVLAFPLTLRSVRGMMKMQLLAPEIKRLQLKFKISREASAAERQDLRLRQQQEVLAVYKENGVSPTGGCLPMLLQFPVFIVLYETIRGLVHEQLVNSKVVSDPLYIGHRTRIYQAIHDAHGHLVSFGLNLSDSVRSTGLSWGSRAPFLALVIVAVALQYLQMKRMNGRNPSVAGANPQMQWLQAFFPLLSALLYISVPVGLNVYVIVSSLFRLIQQELLYRFDPHFRGSLGQLRAES
jgi:YidC/Oxa1 family membrane protein insertase